MTSTPAPANEGAPSVEVVDGKRALVVAGFVQSYATDDARVLDGYWSAMLPDARPEGVLLLGLGAGTVAHLLTRRFGPIPIVGVEADDRVVALGRAYFGLDALPNLAVIVADAFAYVAATPVPNRRFDLILVDLYRGGELARGTLAKPFLRTLKRLLAPGSIGVNLMRDRRLDERLHRLRQVFREVRLQEAGKNVVVWCR
ncbi:MAG: hypothetical protein HYY04_17970 [Chloroflexi bacterium]|nr:hypothetical protein [Chloroflexota bacterium]